MGEEHLEPEGSTWDQVAPRKAKRRRRRLPTRALKLQGPTERSKSKPPGSKRIAYGAHQATLERRGEP